MLHLVKQQSMYSLSLYITFLVKHLLHHDFHTFIHNSIISYMLEKELKAE